MSLPVGGGCKVDWVDQNVYVLDMISAKREASGYSDQAQQFAGKDCKAQHPINCGLKSQI